MKLAKLVPVRQHVTERKVQDVYGTAKRELAAFDARLPAGAAIAIGVGSRGIANIAQIVRAVTDFWNERGMRPFIFPAMGSHGSATAEGQAAVLARFGITESEMGCPIRSSLEVVQLGHTLEGIPVFMDRDASAADAVMIVGRVKWHTAFAGAVESGLLKMLAMGLGKLKGAHLYHIYGYKLGLEHVIRSVGNKVLSSGKIVGGLAILEDAHHHTAQVTAVRAEGMEQREEELLALVKQWKAMIPCDLDVLILDEIGKNISGSGMDTKVVNRSNKGEYNPWTDIPRIERIFVRDLSSASYGNAIGVGLADVAADRLIDKINWNTTLINAVTASVTAVARTPMHFPTDRDCLEAIISTVGKVESGEVTIGWLRNTLELDVMALSENLISQIRANPSLEILGPPYEVPFDEDGNLPGFASIRRQVSRMGCSNGA